MRDAIWTKGSFRKNQSFLPPPSLGEEPELSRESQVKHESILSFDSIGLSILFIGQQQHSKNESRLYKLG